MIKESDQLKIDIIAKVVSGQLSRKAASKILGKHRGTITRYTNEYKKRGPLFVVHGHTGKTNSRKTDEAIKEEIMALICKEYYDFNARHAYEKLAEHDLQKVSYRTLLRWYHEKNFIKRIRRKKRKKHRARDRMPNPGLLLQMDGSHHKWFGNEKTCLIAAIDDADSDVCYGEFFPSETTIACMKVLRKIIEIKGIPRIIYVDRAGVFGGTKRIEFCHFEQACQRLGIQIIYAYSAEAKGRIERLWKTFQGRLIPEMRVNGVSSTTEANFFLNNTFLPHQYAPSFKVPPQNKKSEYKACTFDIYEELTVRHTRIVKNDNTFSYQSKIYQIESSMNCAKGIVEIRNYLDNKVRFFFKNNLLQVTQRADKKVA